MQSIRTLAVTIMVIAGIAMLSLTAAPIEIRNVKAFQQYPWGRVVYISYEVVGDAAKGMEGLCAIKGKDKASGQMFYPHPNYLFGDISATVGLHNVIWDIAGQGETINSDKIVFTVSCYYKWLIVDLSAGANATSYPVTFMAEPPGGFNTYEYKTTKLVLRAIQPGRFMMSGQVFGYDVTLTKPYYIGIFEVTQKQYSLVMGDNPSEFSGDKLPVENVSYNTIRGSSNGAQWPSSAAVDSSSFLGKLRARTGLNFDLPTEAQWEYACLAGATNAGWSCGNSIYLAEKYMWYKENAGSRTHEVGTKLPNPWGLYDMDGNVGEWCLDWYGKPLTSGVDPNGPSSGTNRVLRGASWMTSRDFCYSRNRGSSKPNWEGYAYGFRLVRTLSE